MKFNYSFVFFILLQTETSYKYQEYLYMFLQIGILLLSFFDKKKPFIGFEPTTYALPWRYSTTELKGRRLSQFPNTE
jgi:hypothetical protein